MPTPVIRTQRQSNQKYLEPLAEGIDLEMVLIRGGRFMMGSPDDEPERQDTEGPQHEVTVPTFFMGRYPVTQAEWRVVASFPKVTIELDSDPSKFKGERLPVERVNWFEAVEFCSRLAAHTKRAYRLPSEAEWEYACRAGTATPFFCGETISTDIANYDGNYTYGRGVEGKYWEKTTPVDHFQMANPWGLSDMHGNVWEWCLDHWHDNYEGAPTDGSAWIEDREGGSRVQRGGSWFSDPRDCRSATRTDNYPEDRSYINDSFGFRVVVSPQ